MIEFQKEDNETLARLSRDKDFEHFMNRLESERYRIALENQNLEGAQLHRSQGGVLTITAIIDGVNDAPKILAKIKEKRQ